MEPVITYKRDWSKYTRECLLSKLPKLDLVINVGDVQSNWNKLEEILIKVTDTLAPINQIDYEHLQNQIKNIIFVLNAK